MHTLTEVPINVSFVPTCVHRPRSIWIYFKKTYVMELMEILQSTFLSDATLWMDYNNSYYME